MGYSQGHRAGKSYHKELAPDSLALKPISLHAQQLGYAKTFLWLCLASHTVWGKYISDGNNHHTKEMQMDTIILVKISPELWSSLMKKHTARFNY